MSTLRCAGAPSSSIASVPHSRPYVPSSTSVTSGDATSSPTWPVNTDASFSTRSASSPWPHASWNSTPPAPRCSTTGSLPDGAGTRVEQRDARAVRPRARDVFGLDLVEELEARSCDRALRSPVCMPVSPVATHCTMNRVRTWSSSASRPSELATRMRRRASAYDAVTWRDRVALAARGGVGPREQLDLARLLDRLRAGSSTSCGPVGGLRASSATTCACRRRRRAPRPAAASAAARSPSVERSAVCANPVVSPRTTRMPGAAFAAGDELLDAAVVEAGARRAAVLGEHLGEVAAVAQRVSSVDRRTSVSIMTIPAGSDATPEVPGLARLPIVGRMPLKPGLAAIGDAASSPTTTPRSRCGSGDVPVLGDAAGGRARRGGDGRGRRRRAPARTRRPSATRCSSPPRADAGGRQGRRPRRRSSASRAAG